MREAITTNVGPFQVSLSRADDPDRCSTIPLPAELTMILHTPRNVDFLNIMPVLKQISDEFAKAVNEKRDA